MKCALAPAPKQVWPGHTLFTTSIGGDMLPTAVYMPPTHNEARRLLNVLLFFHGWYVGSKEDLINTDNTRLCETVMNSGRDVVLVAPFLGSKWAPDDGNTLQTARFGEAGYGQRFLTAILDALAIASLPAFAARKAASPGAAPRTVRGVDAISGAGPIVPRPFGVKNLVVACHSGGGVAMRNVVQTLGQFEPMLRECVGLDCLYDPGDPAKKRDEDAKFWFDRAKKPGARPAFFFFGPSTIPESVKLYLMAKGRADALGNARSPAGSALGNVTVRPGHISRFMYGGVTTNVSSTIERVMDDLIAKSPSPAATARGRAAPATATVSKSFVQQAVENFRDGYIFPYSDKDAMGGIHYFIARAFLRERLKSIALA
jgi:hypothetical protein